MENNFYQVGEKLVQQLVNDEKLKISFGAESSQFIRFNGAKVRQTGLVDDAVLAMELISGKRTTSGSITVSGNVDQDYKNALDELLRLRNDVSQLPEDPFIVEPENLGSSREEHTGELPDSENCLEDIIPPFNRVDMSGILASGRIMQGNMNSVGQKHWFATDTFSLDYSLITPTEKMVKATYAGTNWDHEDYQAFVGKSIEKLELMQLPPKRIEPGNYRTFIASAGVADILRMFSWGGTSEAAIQQGESAFCKMRNENIRLSEKFSLSEDFRNGTVPRFNANGETAPELLQIIDKGKLVNTLISTRTAKEYNKKSNFASGGEGFRSPVMAGGSLNEDDVLNELGTGVYLSNLHYLNWSDQIGGRITGMTRYACFWVEDGKIVAPIENMRFDDSLYNFFGDNLEAVTDRARMNPEVGTYEGRELGGTFCPGILLSSFALTL
ncbi:MAG: TldD/PmbA family protein [Candidatus Marinimicrobia bacterium]|jgi:predicted Zn-dependent protease|nr:TldD/PmbA family protein [Candidatus Neomarinimicrobiota bacterium]MBT3633733.1 TldD/PmbA family protein [Candidatus Neomarinimicrobiota bacterium]MBT3682525.1 TldD/PmbA family protein [Candidatus Neomarinimicrobiota bacterium]MBT3759289.1 TldD/PmbA family protein [Candidatus Neomarinimicrobiota bacterium]MBT3894703.1 TldD/PmbA family protein [Candidatus Neomarinimicrobiota bacterium]